jgi:hypothetical protein
MGVVHNMNIRYVCCQPAIQYYAWQVEVMIDSFLKVGVSANDMDIVCAVKDDIVPLEWQKLQQKYPCRFFFYNDTRVNRIYQPSIYFNLMKQHLEAHPELEKEVLFCHDSDIILTKTPCWDWAKYENTWYLSDTKSYICYDYIMSKGEGVYNRMCEIVGIDKLIPKLMNSNSGGAQYIVKHTNYDFWDKVERDSVRLYQDFCINEPQYVKKHEGDYPIQKWTAGMWAFLWNAWLHGHETIIDRRMDFGWVTNHISDTEKYCILHNAGVTHNDKDLFQKGAYMYKYPYSEELQINPEKASWYYYQQVMETGKNSCLIDK